MRGLRADRWRTSRPSAPALGSNRRVRITWVDILRSVRIWGQALAPAYLKGISIREGEVPRTSALDVDMGFWGQEGVPSPELDFLVTSAERPQQLLIPTLSLAGPPPAPPTPQVPQNANLVVRDEGSHLATDNRPCVATEAELLSAYSFAHFFIYMSEICRRFLWWL